MMMVESGVAMGSALLPVVIPGFVAAIGYVTFVGFGTWGGLHAQSLAVPGLPPYNGTHVYDLGIALAELTHVWFDVSPTLAVAVGAAAGMAAGTRLLITSTLFAPARRHRRAGCRSRRRARRLRRLDDGASA
jgi:hypothetical protein